MTLEQNDVAHCYVFLYQRVGTHRVDFTRCRFRNVFFCHDSVKSSGFSSFDKGDFRFKVGDEDTGSERD
jgi:hypothetical protein